MNVDLGQAAQPLHTALQVVELALGQAEQELAELREQRQRLRAAVKALAPELLEEASESTPKKKLKGIPPIGATTLDDVRLVLGQNVGNGTQFSGQDLKESWPDLPTVPTLNIALRHMHANGELRLVRQGQGGKKVYEVIR